MRIKNSLSVLLVASLLNFSTFANAYSTEKSAAIQTAQKDRFLKYIDAEETNLKTDIETYTNFANLLKNAQIDGAVYTVVIHESEVAGGSGVLMAGIHLMGLTGNYSRGVWERSKPIKIMVKLGLGIIAISAVTMGVGMYKASMNKEEMRDIIRNMELTHAQIKTRRSGLLELKKQVGIDTKNISINSEIPNATTLIAPR